MGHPRRIRRRHPPAAPESADRADLARVLRGDERAFERLVERHHGALRRIAAAHGVTGPDAERALARTWGAFLELAGVAAPVAGVRAVLAALLLEELATAAASRPGGVADHPAQDRPQACGT